MPFTHPELTQGENDVWLRFWSVVGSWRTDL